MTDILEKWNKFLQPTMNSLEKVASPTYNIVDSYPDPDTNNYYFSEDDEPVGTMSGLLRLAANAFNLMSGDFTVHYDSEEFIKYENEEFTLSLAGALFLVRAENVSVMDFLNGEISRVELNQLNERSAHICQGLSLFEFGHYKRASEHFKLNDEAMLDMNEFLEVVSPFKRFTVLSNIMSDMGV